MSDVFSFTQFSDLKDRINNCIIRANNTTPAINPAVFPVNRNEWDVDVVKKIIRHFEKNGFKITTHPTHDENVYMLYIKWED